MKILVIDDEEFFLGMVKRVLEKEGHKVFTETSGAKAVKVALECRPDCIITDMIMTPVDGLEVCQEIRRHRDLKELPVIMLSGNEKNMPYWQDRAKAFGADGYLSKPVTANFTAQLDKIISEIKR